MYYLCSENKGADQLRGYREADLRLCFRICKTFVFSRRGSNTKQPALGATENSLSIEILDREKRSLPYYLAVNNKGAVNVQADLFLCYSYMPLETIFNVLAYKQNNYPQMSIHDGREDLDHCLITERIHSNDLEMS